LIKTPKLSGSANIQFDLKLFHDFEWGHIPSTLRIYSWKPKCISLGYSQKMDRLIDGKMARELGWEVVKRPTGGGIVFHNEAEVTYALVTATDNPVLPRGLISSYKKISDAVIFALARIDIHAEIQSSNFKFQNKSQIQNPRSQLCFSYPAEYEIVVKGKKIVGSAQKRGKRALLQQGSIFVKQVEGGAFSVLKQPDLRNNAVSVEEILGREIGFEELSEVLVEGFEKKLGIKFKT